jgi:hypothetical protein
MDCSGFGLGGATNGHHRELSMLTRIYWICHVEYEERMLPAGRDRARASVWPTNRSQHHRTKEPEAEQQIPINGGAFTVAHESPDGEGGRSAGARAVSCQKPLIRWHLPQFQSDGLRQCPKGDCFQDRHKIELAHSALVRFLSLKPDPLRLPVVRRPVKAHGTAQHRTCKASGAAEGIVAKSTRTAELSALARQRSKSSAASDGFWLAP